MYLHKLTNNILFGFKFFVIFKLLFLHYILQMTTQWQNSNMAQSRDQLWINNAQFQTLPGQCRNGGKPRQTEEDLLDHEAVFLEMSLPGNMQEMLMNMIESYLFCRAETFAVIHFHTSVLVFHRF